MDNAKLEAERPLSPHLQIYRPMLTMMMSIAHRISGARQRGRLPPACLVADRASPQGPNAYATVEPFLRQHLRPPAAVPVQLGPDPPHAWRHPPSDLGHRPRPRQDSIEIFAWGTIIGSTALTSSSGSPAIG